MAPELDEWERDWTLVLQTNCTVALKFQTETWISRYSLFFLGLYVNIVKQQEQLYRGYLYWVPHSQWAMRAEFQFEKFNQDPANVGSNVSSDPYRMGTLSAPLSVNYFDPSGIFAKVVTTPVRQDLHRIDPENEGVSKFFLLDAIIGYRLPNRKGIFSVEGRNLLNEDFFYRNIGLQQSEQPLYNQRYSPDRTFFLRLTLNF